MPGSPGPGLPGDLLRPGAYPPPRPSHIELRTTHASWVFLAGDRVYKVKRPVALGFLDYSTLALRKACCEAEVLVNQRLAPSVYLGVVPVWAGAQGASLVSGAHVIDHAVVMRRLHEEDTAQALVHGGNLSSAHVEALAATLAAFYGEARVLENADEPAATRRNVEENEAQLAQSALDARLVARVVAGQRAALDAVEPAIAARAKAGWVRSGHGDLRLEHVYFPGDGSGGRREAPVIIDAIEFNRRFRQIDVALDVAFLAMELEAAGAPSLAGHFLARIALELDDTSFYPLLDFYVAYRAVVRAKVAGFLAADEAVDPKTAARKRDEAHALLALADSHGRADRGPATVLAIGGLIGAGKSTMAEALGRAHGWPVLATDRVRKRLLGVAPTERAPEAAYTPAFTVRTWDALLDRARPVLAAGRSVIIDATFRGREDRARVRRLAAEHGARFLFVEVTASEATLRGRLRQRAAGPSVSDAGEDLLPRFVAGWEPVTELEDHERMVISGEDEARAQALAAVDARLRR